ncbi:hypothetical protein TNCV_17861 [Trichonephila clavipes]|nr:hypothetical protein TNCV_17861 [Trichonephila clavipes]
MGRKLQVKDELTVGPWVASIRASSDADPPSAHGFDPNDYPGRGPVGPALELPLSIWMRSENLTGDLFNANIFSFQKWYWARTRDKALVSLVEEEEMWETPGHPQGFLPLNFGGTEQNRTVTYKAKANDRRKNPSP